MKNFEKIVPAVALGVAMVGLGTADAYALEDTANTTPATPEENVTQKDKATKSPAMDTQIKSLVRTAAAPRVVATNSAAPADSAAPEAAATDSAAPTADNTGETNIPDAPAPTVGAPEATTNTVKYGTNLDFDLNGDGTVDVNFNGELEVTQTPETNEDGEPTGSDKIDIGGNISGKFENDEDAGDPFQEDLDKVNDAAQNPDLNEDGTVKGFDGNKFKEDIEAAFPSEKDEDGNDIGFTVGNWGDETDENGVRKITFTTSKTVGKPLTDDELNNILEKQGITKNAEGKLVNKDGQVVTIKVDDQSNVTNTTTWTITITQQNKDETVNVGGDGSVMLPDEEGSKPSELPDAEKSEESVEEVLGKITTDNDKTYFDGKEAEVTYVNGDSTKVESITFKENGVTKTYSFTYGEKTTVDNIGDLDPAEVVKLLQSAGDSTFRYDKEKGKYFKGNQELTSVDVVDALSKTSITMTVTTTIPGTEGKPEIPGKDQSVAEDEAKRQAIVNAFIDAYEGEKKATLTADDKKAIESQAKSLELNGDKWTLTVTIGGEEVTYNGTVLITKPTTDGGGSSTPGDGGTTIEDKDVPKAETPNDQTKVEAEATIIVTETVDVTLDEASGTGSTTDITIDMVNGAEVKQKFGNTDETVESKTTLDNGTTKTVTIVTTKTEEQEIDGKKVMVTTETTYTFTINEETTTTTGKKFEKGELEAQWNEDKDAWIFDMTGHAFAVKQSGYVVVWYDENVYQKSDEDDLRDYFVGLDNNGGSLDGKKFAFTTKLDFVLKNIVGIDKDNLAAHVMIENGKVYVYGKGKMSHFMMGEGSSTTTEITDSSSNWEATGTRDDETPYTGKGSSAFWAGVPETPGSEETTTHAYNNANQHEGSLKYTYEAPSITVKVDGSTSANRNVNANVTITPDDDDNGGTNPTDPTDPDDERPNRPTTPDDERPNRPTTPDEPTTDIPDEEPPLVDVPDEPGPDQPDPPVTEIPDEEPPLVNVPETPTVTIPAEDVPLVKAPAPTPNTVEILEEEVPLADVPETGEAPTSLLAAAAACFSALGLGILKKRKED